jgi:hypothetical protein
VGARLNDRPLVLHGARLREPRLREGVAQIVAVEEDEQITVGAQRRSHVGVREAAAYVGAKAIEAGEVARVPST